MTPRMQNPESLDRTLAAISDHSRREILARLMEGEARMTDLAAPFPMSLNGVSKHVRVLEGAGLIRRRVSGREHWISLQLGPLDEAAEWVERYRRFWEEKLASLSSFLQRRQADKDNAKPQGKENP